MTRPATGTTFKAGGFGTVDNRLFSRGPMAAVLIRDNRGAATDISPYVAGVPPTVNWWPLAEDQQLRDDLFASVLVNGDWQLNSTANDGWWLAGALDERGGPDRKADVRHDDAMILQSNWPFDTDIISEGISISFTAVEVFKPMLKRLRMNLPLVDADGNNLVEHIGETDFVISKPVDAEYIDRQILLVFAKPRGSSFVYSVEGYPCCRLTDIGNYKRSKTDPDAPSLTYTVLPDAYHMDLDASDPLSGELVPSLYSEWLGGSGWTDIYGSGS